MAIESVAALQKKYVSYGMALWNSLSLTALSELVWRAVVLNVPFLHVVPNVSKIARPGGLFVFALHFNPFSDIKL